MAAHRYWRFYVTHTIGGFVGFSEVELCESIDGADLTGSGTASASSEFSGSHTAANAVDNNNSTEWAGSSSGTQWWKYDFGSGVAYDITHFRIFPRNGLAVSQSPEDFLFQYSDDDSSWTTAATYVSISWTNEKLGFSLVPNALAHRYWRLGIRYTDDGYIVINEVELRNAVSGSDLTGSGTASASTSEGTSPPGNAVDNNTGTYWTPYPSGVPQWWSYDFGAGNAYKIIEFKITPHGSLYATESPRDFTLQYSDDNAYWVIADMYNGVTWSSSVGQVFSVDTVATVELTVSAGDSLSLSDEVSTSLGVFYTITITDNFAFAEGTVKVQRKNAPNIPLVISDAFSDGIEIIGEFSLQLDTIRDAEFGWEISDALIFNDEIYASEIDGYELADAISLSDEIAGIGLGIEVYDSMQDVWYSEDEEDLVELTIAVPMTLEISDALSLSDALEMVRASERDVEDRYTLNDSARVISAGSFDAGSVADLLALSDALEIGFNASLAFSDSLSLADDAAGGGVNAILPMGLEVVVPPIVGVELLTEYLSFTDAVVVLKERSNLSYLRSYLNDVPR